MLIVCLPPKNNNYMASYKLYFEHSKIHSFFKKQESKSTSQEKGKRKTVSASFSTPLSYIYFLLLKL